MDTVYPNGSCTGLPLILQVARTDCCELISGKNRNELVWTEGDPACDYANSPAETGRQTLHTCFSVRGKEGSRGAGNVSVCRVSMLGEESTPVALNMQTDGHCINTQVPGEHFRQAEILKNWVWKRMADCLEQTLVHRTMTLCIWFLLDGR